MKTDNPSHAWWYYEYKQTTVETLVVSCHHTLLNKPGVVASECINCGLWLSESQTKLLAKNCVGT